MDEVHPGGPVVVGVDGSHAALAAVRWAAAEASRRGAALRLVAAVAWMAYEPAGGTAFRGDERQILTVAAEGHLETARVAARGVAPEPEITGEVRGGDPVQVLRDEAESAGMVVLGSRGRGGFAELLLGSVAIAVAARARSPVVVVRGHERAPGSTGPVVVGVDGPQSEEALGFAFDEAACRRTPLVAVHAMEEPMIDPYLAPHLHWERIHADEKRDLEGRLAPWTARYPQVDVEPEVARGPAAGVLVGRSRDADLVVVGSRGRGTVRGLLLGSVGQAVLHHAHCPVAVVGALLPEG